MGGISAEYMGISKSIVCYDSYSSTQSQAMSRLLICYALLLIGTVSTVQCFAVRAQQKQQDVKDAVEQLKGDSTDLKGSEDFLHHLLGLARYHHHHHHSRPYDYYYDGPEHYGPYRRTGYYRDNGHYGYYNDEYYY